MNEPNMTRRRRRRTRGDKEREVLPRAAMSVRKVRVELS